jgi:tRNA modification GTPase
MTDKMGLMYTRDIITALASPEGAGAVAVIRVSGSGCLDILKKIFKKKSTGQNRTPVSPSPGRFGVGYIYDSDSDKVIDQVIVLTMQAPRSYTGEDSFEVQCHAGPAVVSSILSLLMSRGARLADPGEFTKRAVMNNRMDLVQAEAVLDLVNAATAAARDAALDNLGGALSEMISKLTKNLIELAAWFEALIDFPEDDVDEIEEQEKKSMVLNIRNQLGKLAATYDTGRMVRNGVNVCMLGRVNVGKSSLLNALTGLDCSIVTPHAGTTRDIVQGVFRSRGILIRLSDTAGIRNLKTSTAVADNSATVAGSAISPFNIADPVEKEGIKRAVMRARESDCIIVVIDSSKELDPLDIKILRHVKRSKKPFLVIFNKSDLPERADYIQVHTFCGKKPVEVSALKKENLDIAVDKIAETMTGFIPQDRGVMVSSARQMNALVRSASFLDEIWIMLEKSENFDIIATQLREAIRSLDSITGGVSDQQILDCLFSRFCIGK